MSTFHLALPSASSHPASSPNAAASSSTTPTKPKPKKPRRKDRQLLDDDQDISAEDLVGADRTGDDDGEGDGDGEEDEDLEVAGEEGEGARLKRMNKKRRGETLMLRNNLDAEQAKRFDVFSSIVIPKPAVKKLNKDLYDQNINPNLVSVVAGMAKVFVADVVELAKDMQPYTPHPTGPLRPYHLKLAKMRLEEMGMAAGPSGGKKGSMGLRRRKGMFRK
ncbi:transcription initiation factor TFIID subunit 11, partial [Tremellales sp. Uapishka_1]